MDCCYGYYGELGKRNKCGAGCLRGFDRRGDKERCPESINQMREVTTRSLSLCSRKLYAPGGSQTEPRSAGYWKGCDGIYWQSMQHGNGLMGGRPLTAGRFTRLRRSVIHRKSAEEEGSREMGCSLLRSRIRDKPAQHNYRVILRCQEETLLQE